eukprot:COSAG03_NODE_930_length_5274_cov_21.824348_4_plen_126_part_00
MRRLSRAGRGDRNVGVARAASESLRGCERRCGSFSIGTKRVSVHSSMSTRQQVGLTRRACALEANRAVARWPTEQTVRNCRPAVNRKAVYTVKLATMRHAKLIARSTSWRHFLQKDDDLIDVTDV